MRSPAFMETIQIEFTSACVLKCSNCTRFCGTHKVPFFLEWDEYTRAIDSLVDWVKEFPQGLVGAMGGEPLLHPKFEQMCDYALSKIPRERLGLWSTFPDSPNYRKYREVICRTFANVLLNDHSREDILHAPVLMASEDYYRKQCPECRGTGLDPYREVGMGEGLCKTCGGKKTVTDDESLFLATEKCWVQESWSACVNPKGAWFCEVAGALSDLFDGPEGWKVQPGWWKKTPMDFKEQREWACRKCGAALPIKRVRNSQDPTDDVSESNLERLKTVKSRKVAKGEYAVRSFEMDSGLTVNHGYPNQTYKDMLYRQGIAKRYGIVLTINGRGYWEPHREEDMPEMPPPRQSLFHILAEQYQ